MHSKELLISNSVELVKKNLNNKGVNLYNELPSHLKNLKNTQYFKRTKIVFIATDVLLMRGISF